MNAWIWVGVWAVILMATGFGYFQIFTTLRAKAKRLEGQLAILQGNLEKLQAEMITQANFEAEPSAIEQGLANAVADRVRLIETRSKAKEVQQRRLINRLKKLQQESD